MGGLSSILLAASLSLSGGSGYHAHPIRDAKDAIASAYARWKAAYPLSGPESEQTWQTEFTARKAGGFWVVRQTMAAPQDHRGTVIYLDAKDGHIVTASIVD